MQKFLDKASAWMTPERSIAFQGIGRGLSQLAAGQAPDLSPAYQALQQRQQAAQMRESLRGSGLLDKFTPQQRAILAQMEPSAAQQIIAQTVFAPAPAPRKGVEINDQLVDPVTGQIIGDFRDSSTSETVRIVAGEEAAKFGLPADGAYELTFDENMRLSNASAIGGGGTTVNLNQGGDDKFAEASAKHVATMFGDMAVQGAQANAELGQVAQMESLLGDGEVGGTADAWKSWAQNTLGVSIAGGRVEALNALISQLVPQQRPPGSGVMSDADLQLYRESLPQLVNSPQGNEIILNTMRGLAQYKRAQGEIASEALMGRITREEAIARLYALPDPLKQARESISGLDRRVEEIEAEKDMLLEQLRGAME